MAATAAALLAVAACTPMHVYSHFEHVGIQGWDKGDTLTYTIIPQQAASCQLQLDLRITNIYPYTQLTLATSVRHSASPDVYTGTVTIDVTDDEGLTQGRGISVLQYSTKLPSVEALSATDTLTVTVAHTMSRRLLPGISDVGITCHY